MGGKQEININVLKIWGGYTNKMGGILNIFLKLHDLNIFEESLLVQI